MYWNTFESIGEEIVYTNAQPNLQYQIANAMQDQLADVPSFREKTLIKSLKEWNIEKPDLIHEQQDMSTVIEIENAPWKAA